jgi:hypothetical protein
VVGVSQLHPTREPMLTLFQIGESTVDTLGYPNLKEPEWIRGESQLGTDKYSTKPASLQICS